MTEEKVYTIFREHGSELSYLTVLSAKNLFEAKMKARMRFKEEEKMYIVDNNAIKKIVKADAV